MICCKINGILKYLHNFTSKNNYVTFLKGAQITNITISLDNVGTDAPTAIFQNGIFGNMVFSFNITPVEKPSK